MLSIQNTAQYDQFKSFFVCGVNALEERRVLIEAEEPCSLTGVHKLSAVLLSLSQDLSAFLYIAASAQSQSTNTGGRKIPRSEKAWLTAAITNLRVECHRYSLAVLQIAMAMEKNPATAGRTREELLLEDHCRIPSTLRLNFIDDNGIVMRSSATTSISTTPSFSTSTRVQTSRCGTEASSPTGTTTPTDEISECESG